MIIAILMAGGKGTRLKSNIEKPLFKFKSKTLIDHVLNNLSNSKYIGKIIVATSPHTPNTKEYITKKINNSLNNFKNLSNSHNKNIEEHIEISGEDPLDYIETQAKTYMDYIETPGEGYIEDLSFLLDKFEKNSKNDVLVIINVDLPFVTSDIIDNVLKKYFKSEKIAMSVHVPLEIFNKYGIKPSYVFDNLVPSGLNILTSQNIEQVEEKLIIPKLELALNINTLDDIHIANEIFK
ncbi:MAG: NTP transferase domain-containing protein [Methanobacteriaceae archaeon]|jgi:adenosylcobinamide-phosphate guanylyltransferase|nr:NTP transferase domain-containing protein [Candidatus Methanorudis spinitermitis]